MQSSLRSIRLVALALSIVFIIGSIHVSLYPNFICHYQALGTAINQSGSWATIPASPAQQSIPREPRKLHHLIPINRDRADSFFCKTLLSSLVHGYSPLILNWEAQGDVSFMQRQKLPGVYDFIINNLTIANDDDLIFMMDAFDIWLQQSPEALIRRYEELSNGSVVIGVDKGCWPNEWEGPSCQNVPESPIPKGTFGGGEDEYEENMAPNTRPRWANSGTVIGSVASMRPLYKHLASQMAGSTLYTEQGIFNDLLLEGQVTPDYWFRLFWADASDWDSGVIINTRHPLDGIPASLDSTIPYHLVPPLLHHRYTGEVPVAIHFNDYYHKHYMNEWWGKPWWTKPDPRFRRIVLDRLEEGRHTVTFAHNGSTATWLDLCPKDRLDISLATDV